MSGKRSILIACLLIAGAAVLWGIFRHSSTEAETGGGSDANTAPVGEPVAAVVKVERRTLSAPLTLAGAFKPFQDVDVHAKVAGYIKKIYVDVGSHVKQGQTLAVLEVPELQAELAGADAAVRRAQEEIRRSQGDVDRAKSTHMAVHSMYVRLTQAAQQSAGLVAQQEIDDAQSKDLGSEAQISSAEAELDAAQQALAVAQATQRQYTALSDYSKITAPYDGVVTVRYADTGSLIAAGTSESKQAEPVVRLAQISVLRLVLPIPESIACAVRAGDPVKVHIDAQNKDYVGKVTRYADELDPQTRTMHAEVDFQNPNGALLPGMYVVATIPQVEKKDVLTVPLEAVDIKGSDEGSVLRVDDHNVLEERDIHLGFQSNNRVEVTSGLNEGDRVVIGSRNVFRNGMKVRPKPADSTDPSLAGSI
jgi:RND family efflux transporter MFP subunit